MTSDNINILVELIKFDMEQIRHYSDAILNISSMSMLAAFAVSAFIYTSANLKKGILIAILVSTHLVILVVLYVSTEYYISGIDASRWALEMRECALKSKIEIRREMKIGVNELYPPYPPEKLSCDPKYRDLFDMYSKNCASKDKSEKPAGHPQMKSVLEKYPLPLAIIVIWIKLITEIYVLAKIGFRVVRDFRRETEV